MPWTWLLLPQIKNAKLFYILRFLLPLLIVVLFHSWISWCRKKFSIVIVMCKKTSTAKKEKFCSGWNQQYSERTLRTRRKPSERKSAMAKLKIFFWQVLNYDDDFLHSHSMSHRSDFVDCHFSKALLHILVGL